MEAARPGSIVIGVDGSKSSQAALDWAALEARRRKRAIHLLHALGADSSTYAASAVPIELIGERPVDVGRRDVDEVLEEARGRVAWLTPSVEVSTETVAEHPGAALVELSERASLVVTGARGLGPMRSSLLGSVSLQVAMHARCPVVVVRDHPTPAEAAPRIVVGIDGSARSMPALSFAFEQASSSEVGLTVVHAWWLEFAEGAPRHVGATELWDQLAEERRLVLAESLAGWREKYPDVNIREHVLRAHPVEALVDHSVGAELVVVGSRGLGGFRGLVLGSVSHGVLQRALCPVAVVRETEGS